GGGLMPTVALDVDRVRGRQGGRDDERAAVEIRRRDGVAATVRVDDGDRRRVRRLPAQRHGGQGRGQLDEIGRRGERVERKGVVDEDRQILFDLISRQLADGLELVEVIPHRKRS